MGDEVLGLVSVVPISICCRNGTFACVVEVVPESAKNPTGLEKSVVDRSFVDTSWADWKEKGYEE